MAKCEVCGAEFIPNSSTHKFCSLKCRNTYHNRNGRDRYRKQHKLSETKVCAFCGEEFTPDSLKSRYCSGECRSLANNNGGKIRTCTCRECGIKFVADYDAKYCGKKCRNAAKERELAAEAMLKATNQPTKTLSDWCREADECGLDYGTYRGLIAQGRTYEQLKAAGHTSPCHNHASKAERSGKPSYGYKIC